MEKIGKAMKETETSNNQLNSVYIFRRSHEPNLPGLYQEIFALVKIQND